MSALLNAQHHLNTQLQGDVLGQLATAVAWLDPLWANELHSDPYDEEQSTLVYALAITRRAFPDVYVEAVNALRYGNDYHQLDRLICSGISKAGLPLEDLENLQYGIPIPFYGIDLEEPATYEQWPELLPLVKCFGISHDPTPHRIIEIPDWSYDVARRMSESLLDQTDLRYRQLGQLLGFVFSCSGNSTVDYSYESSEGMQPLNWEPDDLALAIEIIHEADSIMSEAQAGFALLKTHPHLLSVIEKQVNRLIHRLSSLPKAKGKSRDKPERIRLHWPPLGDSNERDAQHCVEPV
jgi:hypothetical protein